jgi:hypothetical protein
VDHGGIEWNSGVIGHHAGAAHSANNAVFKDKDGSVIMACHIPGLLMNMVLTDHGTGRQDVQPEQFQ